MDEVELLTEHLERWEKIERCTDPADRVAAEDALKRVYKHLALPPPVMVWCNSPFSAGLSRAISDTLATADPVLSKPRPSLATFMRSTAGSYIGGAMKRYMRNELLAPAEERMEDIYGREQFKTMFQARTTAGFRCDTLSTAGLNLDRSKYYQRHTAIALSDGVRNVTGTSLHVINALDQEIHRILRRGMVPEDVFFEAVPTAETVLGRQITLEEQEKVLQYFQFRNMGQFVDSMQRAVVESCYGQFDARYLALPEYFLIRGKKAEQLSVLEPLIQLAQSTAGFLAHEHVCWFYERPKKISTNQNGFLHCEKECALEYEGWPIFAWNGIVVEHHVVLDPTKITLQHIERESNIERRRVLIQRFGEGKFLQESNAVVIDEDPNFGILYRRDLNKDEPLQMVKVKNSTPESDGSFKSYFIRVPPQMNSAREAIAWTFRMGKDDYKPSVES